MSKFTIKQMFYIVLSGTILSLLSCSKTSDLAIPSSSPVPGVSGSQGVKGDAGLTGPQGVQGTPGTAGAQGPKGDTGLQGPQGTQGVSGAKGTTGATGSTGSQGVQGLTGPQGLAGPQGPKCSVKTSYTLKTNVCTSTGPTYYVLFDGVDDIVFYTDSACKNKLGLSCNRNHLDGSDKDLYINGVLYEQDDIHFNVLDVLNFN